MVDLKRLRRNLIHLDHLNETYHGIQLIWVFILKCVKMDKIR